MRLTVVGCSGSFPGPTSPASCYLVEHDATKIVLDMGNGSLGSLQRFIDIRTLDAVVLSHLHVDHFVDLCSYYVALKYPPNGPGPSVDVWGPAATPERVAAAYGGSDDADFGAHFTFRTLAESFRIGPFEIETRPMAHPVEAYAMRVTAGGSALCYSGDTGPNPELVELARGCDVALFEASMLIGQPNPPDLHLTAADAAKAACAAGVDRLVLTHLVPWNTGEETLSEAQQVFPDSVLAHPGLVVEV
jgi:ribonuclease BN (tRNA processing enzyme)